MTTAGHDAAETVIDARQFSLLRSLRELWRARELGLAFVRRDIKVRYKQTALGAAWALLQPLMQMAVFSVIFGRLANIPSNGHPYPVFVFSGLLGWIFFSATLNGAINSVLQQANLIRKVYFPRLVLPFAAAGSPLLDCVISFLLLGALMLWYGVPFTASLLLIPAGLLLAAATAIGVGSFLAALVARYRDFAHVQTFLTYLWLFLTPVIYPVSYLPEQWRLLIYVNPMSGAVELLRFAILGTPANLTGLGISVACALAALCGGVAYFLHAERRFADVI